MTESASTQHRNPWWAVFFFGLAVLMFVLTNRTARPPAPAAPVVPPPLPLMLSNTFRLDGRLMTREATNPVSGEVLERYRDGTLKSSTVFSNGLLHGVSEGFHTNGQIQVREFFTNGVSHGTRTKWYAGGATQSVAEIVGGQLHGWFRRWHENGRLAQEIPMVGGQPDGLSRAWHTNGQLKAEARLEAGRVLSQQFWDEAGQPHRP
jgi:antitoxin component YwqK of YwqJK toxin-antitoxin module